ncbi:MAG: hypothetical protein HZB25_12750 [Candidatus Eisenbacteria bacterium]|nr:hypothetical protein [Candidatus Eisenbacteria bacterium]
MQLRRPALAAGLLATLISASHAAPPAPAGADSAAWAELARGAEAVYVTAWDARGVAGCRGVRGGLASRVEADVDAALREAVLEARLAGRGVPRRARCCFLREGRSTEPDAPLDVAGEALLLESDGRTAVILPGEARTAAYAWRRARRLLGISGTAVTASARVYQVRSVDMDSLRVARWLRAFPREAAK